MNVRVVSILLFLFGSFFLEGQDKTDSLLNVLKTERTDTTRILLLNDLAKEFRNFNPDTAIIISKDALKSALSLKYTKGIAVSAHNTGAEYYMEGNYNEALRYFNYALPAWKLVYPPDGGIKKRPVLAIWVWCSLKWAISQRRWIVSCTYWKQAKNTMTNS